MLVVEIERIVPVRPADVVTFKMSIYLVVGEDKKLMNYFYTPNLPSVASEFRHILQQVEF